MAHDGTRLIFLLALTVIVAVNCSELASKDNLNNQNEEKINRRVIRQANNNWGQVLPTQYHQSLHQQQQQYNAMSPVQRQNRKAPAYYPVQPAPAIPVYRPAPAAPTTYNQKPQARPVYYTQQPQSVYYYPTTTMVPDEPEPKPQTKEERRAEKKQPQINAIVYFLKSLRLAIDLTLNPVPEPTTEAPAKETPEATSSEESY